jgi:hypothetical protein
MGEPSSRGYVGWHGDAARAGGQCIGLSTRARDEKCESLKRFSTFSHVMQVDANSQEKLLELVSETLERAVLHSDSMNVSFPIIFSHDPCEL